MSSHVTEAISHYPCWSCQGMVIAGVSFCPTCQIIQPPSPDWDHFNIFTFAKEYPIDLAELERGYQAQQQQFHPDRFATRSTKERRYSLEHVTRLNKAYQTLKDPLLRSIYLLELSGYQAPEDGKGAASDPMFLMEVMELREQLEAIDLTSPGADESLQTLRQQTEASIGAEEQEIRQRFAECGAVSDVLLWEKIWEKIAQANDRFRYHQRFLEAVDQAEEQLYGGEDF